MLKVTTTILGTDLSAANARRALRNAEEFALKFHRRKYMPLHFKSVARLRYKSEYRKAPGKYSRGGPSRKNSQGRRDVGRERRMVRGTEQANEQATEAQLKRPIFDSGLTQLKVLKGGTKITGRFDSRGITYNVPFYIKINPAGQTNKVKALNAINTQEERKLADLTGRKFVKELEKKKTKRKG